MADLVKSLGLRVGAFSEDPWADPSLMNGLREVRDTGKGVWARVGWGGPTVGAPVWDPSRGVAPNMGGD